MNQTAAILTRQAAKLFQPGRESLYTTESPVVADGALFDIFRHAQDHTIQGLQTLSSVLTTGAQSVDGRLAAVEDDLRQALREVSILRQHIAAVPSNFGEG